MQGVADVSTVYIEFNIIYIMRNDVEFRQGADLRILTTWARQLMAFQCRLSEHKRVQISVQ